MNDQDQPTIRDCFAMFKAMTGANPEECYKFADAMMEARKPTEEGILAIKRKVKEK